jgi:hypothetical protein
MPRIRISLATLLGFIAVSALGLAGMISASSLWTAAAATVTLAVLLAAVLAAFLLAGSDRAFWAGFALFGWAYLMLVNWDWIGGQFGHDLTAGLGDAAESLFPEVSVPLTPAGIATTSPIPASGVRLPQPSAVNALRVPGPDYYVMVRQRQIKIGGFVQISRMCLTFLFAVVGGFIARTLAERRDERSRSSRTAAP